MANYFLLHNKATTSTNAIGGGAADDFYTVPANRTTTVVLGLMLCNIHTSQITVDVKVHNDAGAGQESSDIVSYLLKGVPIPAGSSLEVLSGNKINLNTLDKIQIQSSVAAKVSATMSIMEQD
tara:strand:- start:194 stop:562 length:369 start_codon:yes stop_codon:yes gene_type:complete